MRKNLTWLILSVIVLLVPGGILRGANNKPELQVEFHASDRCEACHNQLTTASGKDVSIGTAWRASIMANSSRDPYWQGSVRRETLDHPEVTDEIQNECSICHMPITRYEAVSRGGRGQVFAYLPFTAQKQGKDADEAAAAEDGVTCSVCHQISKERLGTRESYTGQFVIERPRSNDSRPEFGPFLITPGHQKIMQSSTGGFRPEYAEHIRDSALCGSCHQLYTIARGEGGKPIGTLPEQVPYLEWLHSDYPGKSSCQGCHMPEISEDAPISSVLGTPRVGVHRHTFVGANFFMLNILNRYRDELDVTALPQELTAASETTMEFLRTQSAKLELRNIETAGGRLHADVMVQNLTGHKLPTAYPSRRAWLHFVVRDRDGRAIFESGAVNLDGSIQGNDNDVDRARYEPHYREITSPEQVEIYEDILGDWEGRVTTGLLTGVRYLKDNRLLPSGFDKKTAVTDVQVIGDALDDPSFTAGGDLVRYSVPIGEAQGPFRIDAELWYQPIGYRWAHNLEPYHAAEPQRFAGYYQSMSKDSATILAHAEATR
jgi:hypothetical protein